MSIRTGVALSLLTNRLLTKPRVLVYTMIYTNTTL
jgi:hypothetical protein